MDPKLLEAVWRLRIKSEDGEDCIDAPLHEQRPQKRKRPSPAELKKQLEDEFLTPPTAFSLEWLNKVQE